MISIHAIQFLVEIINCTCLLLAGNFCSGRNNKKQERGGEDAHIKPYVEALKACSKIVCL